MAFSKLRRLVGLGRGCWSTHRTTNAITVVLNSVELAEMDASHAALDELLNETRRRGFDSTIANTKAAPDEHFADRAR